MRYFYIAVIFLIYMQHYEARSVILGRKPAEQDGKFKTLLVALFNSNNPHKKGEIPLQVLEFENCEQASVQGLNAAYYLEGNDLVINDLQQISVDVRGTCVTIHGKQDGIKKK